MRVCMLGVDFDVDEPPELVDALAEIQARGSAALGARAG